MKDIKIQKYKIIALIGESGSGKDTLLKELSKSKHIFNEIISYTTRSPREGEKDGVDYHFVSIEEFSKKVLSGEMLEATVFNGWGYGTAEESLSIDKVNIGVFNPDGIYALLDNPLIDLTVYYLRVSDKTRLIRQLQREEDPDVNEIIRRFQKDKKDFLNLDFEYNVLNNENGVDLNNSVKTILENLI